MITVSSGALFACLLLFLFMGFGVGVIANSMYRDRMDGGEWRRKYGDGGPKK